MKYLNLGCGSHYSTNPEWTNVDFVSTKAGVIGHNLVQGVPFEDNTFDLVYHSHVLEHFSKDDGEKFTGECIRVLKPGGVLRIVVPNLEGIIRKYISLLEEGLKDPGNELVRANYEWMLIELFDQTVRNTSGGRMGEYLSKDMILNEKFVFERIGEEGNFIRKHLLAARNKIQPVKQAAKQGMRSKIRLRLKNYLLNRWGIDQKAHEIGKFRSGGEIHQWMYDRYSLPHLLQQKGLKNIELKDAFTSYITGWAAYELDGKAPVTRKPDSLFTEGIKK